MKNIAIVGAGGFGREIKMLIDQINELEKKYTFIGYFDDGKEKGSLVNGYPVIGCISDLNFVEENLSVVLALGNPIFKRNAVEEINNAKINYETLIHPSVIIGSDAVNIGRGTIICAGSIITCNIEIKDFVTINLACTIGHDSVIENYVSIMPGVNVSGEVILNEGVYVGTGSKIINQVAVGDYAIIGAGAVVSKSLPENCTAVGIPAKVIKINS